MSFHYSFQKILDMKEKEKEQAEMSYSKSMQTLQVEQKRLSTLQQTKEEMERRMTRNEESISLSELKDSYQYLHHLQKLVLQAHHTTIQAEKEVEHKQEILTEKAMDEKVWSKLKDKSYVRYIETMKATEQKELDEIAIARYYRQRAARRE
jgi:flagellar protein FliJ